MTKKLFVVLVVVAAMLVTISWAVAAKKGVQGVLEKFEMKKFTDQQSATPMPKGQLAEKKAAISLMPERSTKEAPTTTMVGPVQGQINRAGGGKDFCDLYGVPAYDITDWFYGLEWYANYQDPEDFGCVDVWPFEVVGVGFNIQVDYAMDIDVTGYVFEADFTDPGCPVPGAILCETPMYTISLPSDGHWIVGLPLTDQCCVDGPYFAGIYIWTDLYGSGADAVAEDDPTDICRSYNDYGNGWEDLVVVHTWPGEMILWSNGYTAPQNDCGAPPETLCELMHDNGTAASYFYGWNVGDLNAVYMDPEALCPDCDPVYPMRIDKVKGYFYDFAGAGALDVIVHLYEVGALCDGPGVEIYSSEPITVTIFYPDWAEITLPDVVCVEGPFFLAIEYASGTTGTIPCLLFDNQQNIVDTCYQWNWYDGYSPPWIEWWDFWGAGPILGWLMLRAISECDAVCPAECYMQQDPGVINYYFGHFGAGDVLGKYFDPELYCEDPVYPLKINDVDFVLYDFAGMGSVDIIVDVHIVCHDSCDGPGTQIYKSDPFTITTFYPDMAHIDLEDVVCVYEPFFVSLEYATGVQGSTPSFLFSDETYPCDTCHAWLYWASGGYPFWIEWYDFWLPPTRGCPIVRVGGSTSHPDCAEEPCDTTLETMWGGFYADYYWRNPSRYGDQYLNQRFDMPLDHGGRLDEIEIAFYSDGTGCGGNPDPNIYVWLSDGFYPIDNNPPYQAIAEFNLTYADIVWYPAYNVVQTWDRGIIFDPGESFHIGYGHPYIDGDTLCCLSTDGSLNSDRSVEWSLPGQWGTMLDDWSIGCDFLINAVICPYEPLESTFTIACSPSHEYAVPGDPETMLYQVDVGKVLNYDLPVDLSCTPPAGINVSFYPDNYPPPYTSYVSVSVDISVAYGDYTLTFVGTGGDGQIKTCSVILTVQAECGWVFFDDSPPLTPTEVEVISCTPSETVLRAIVHGMCMKDTTVGAGTFKLITVPEMVSTPEEGRPQLPAIGEMIGLSTLADTVTVTDFFPLDSLTFGNLHIFPLQLQTKGAYVPPFVMDTSFYSNSNYFYPTFVAQAGPVGYWHILPISNIGIFPFQYNPVSATLRVYNTIYVTLSHPGPPVTDTIPRSFTVIYEALTNYDCVSQNVQQDMINFRAYELIIVPDSLDNDPSIAKLIKHLKMKGFNVTKMKLSDAGGTGAPDQVADSLKKTIKGFYEKPECKDKPKYVTLIGDYPQVPAKKDHFGLSPQALAPDVDVLSDEWYELVNGNDYVPDLMLGRIPTSDTATLRKIIDKKIKNDTTNANANKILLVASKESPEYRKNKEEVRKKLEGAGFDVDTVYGSSGGTNDQVTTAINNGVGQVNYRGHGSPTCWANWAADSSSWTKTDVSNLNVTCKEPIVWGITCYTNKLDHTEDCLGEHWIKSCKATAYFGSTRASPTDMNSRLDKFIAEADSEFKSKGETADLGHIIMKAKANLVKSVPVFVSMYGSWMLELEFAILTIHEYLLLGDPEQTKWTKGSEQPGVSHPSSIQPGQQEFSITIDLHGSPIGGTIVSLLKEGDKGDEVFEALYTDDLGEATFDINPQTPGVMYVTVWGRNLKVYFGEVPVYIRGDANGSGSVDLADAVYIVNWLFIGGPAPDPLEAGDANCDGQVNLADAVYIVNWLFIGGPPPGC